MSQNQNKSSQGNGLGYWIVALSLLTTGIAAPVGLLMIVLKLLEGNKGKGRSQDQGHLGARTSASPSAEALRRRQSEQVQQRQLAALDKKGKKLTVIGGAIAAAFGFAFLASLGDAAHWLIDGEFAWFLEELLDLLPVLCFLGGGLGCLWAGLRKRKKVRRYRGYLAMIGQKQSASISALAAASGRTPAQVREDLEDMLSDGLFPQGFLDYGGDALVLSGEGLSDAPRQKAAPTASPSQENAVLAEIREVNEAIDNPKLSAQIDRIGIITAKILEYQKSRPEKAPQLHSFLSYYLPTTLKILRAYGQLEDQEVSGKNITAAMARIEGMMDKVVEGFEKQLDLLFQGDAMDITTDVEVLERMLAKDGLSDAQGMTLGI